MPVLWQPIAPTNLNPISPNPASYTLIVIATQDIDVGVIFRFVMWDGLNYIYNDSEATTRSVFELTTIEKIPAGTKVIVSMTTLSTKMIGYNSSAIYSTTGTAIPAANFKQYNSLIALAYVPAPSGGSGPAGGQPQFAIGFSYHPALQEGCNLIDPPTPLTITSVVNTTAPNFPDQFSGVPNPIIFNYEIVYPTVVPGSEDSCYRTYGIKFQDQVETFVTGSWLNLRQVLAQPDTIIQNGYETINNWVPYCTLSSPPLDLPPYSTSSPPPFNGPFNYVLQEGQLAVVYFKPYPANYAQDTAITSTSGLPIGPLGLPFGPAEIAVVVTVPIPAASTIYATVLGYDAANNGFGPRNPDLPVFVNLLPTFTWITGNVPIAAGTVILFTGIGNYPSAISVQDAHNSAANVGSVNSYNFPAIFPVVSVSFMASWGIGAPQRFITAALSNQYVGDYPTLSPSLTIAPSPFALPSIYGQGQTFNNGGLTGTVQSAMVNSGAFATLGWTTPVPPASLPIFKNMATFSL